MILDTHVFLWFVHDDPALSNDLKDLIESKRDQIYISPISFWEIAMLAEKGRIRTRGQSVSSFVRNLATNYGTHEAPFNIEIALLSRTLEFIHGDPADRFIAATAKYLGMPLVTADRQLANLPWLKTIS
jgi:PIN domain nuclease of toxin-antitoxin system